MRLDFKKGLSFVLALVMMVSTLTVVNVSSVLAANTVVTWELNKENTWSTKPKSETTVKATVNGRDLIYHGGSSCTFDATNGIKMGGGLQPNSYTSNPWTSRYCELSVPAKASVKLTIVPNKKTALVYKWGGNTGSEKVYEGAAATENPTIYNLTNEEEKEQTLYFSFKGKEYIKTVELTIPETTATNKYKWEIKTESLGSVPAENVTLETIGEGGTHNTLVYKNDTGNGNDHKYIVNPDSVLLSINDEGGIVSKSAPSEDGTVTVTVTPTDDDFIPTKEYNTTDIKFENAGGRYVRFDCENHKNTVHTIYLDAQGQAKGTVVPDENGKAKEEEATDGKIYLPCEKFYVYIAGGLVDINGSGKAELDLQSSQPEAINGVFTAYELSDVDEAATQKGAINLTRSLVMQDDVSETYIHAGTVLGEGNYFEVTGTSDFAGDAMLVIDEAGMDIDDPETRSNVLAIELKTFDDEGQQANNSVRFHTASDLPKNVYMTVSCSSSKDTEHDSIIALREGSDKNNVPTESIHEMTIEGSKGDGSIADSRTDFTYGPLKPNMYYGIYNKGTTEKNDNVRLFSVQFTKEETVEFVDELNISDLDTGEITADTITENKKFKIIKFTGNSTSKIEVVEENKTITLPDKTEKALTKHLKTGGNGDETKRSIQFTVGDKPGKIYVYVLANANTASDSGVTRDNIQMDPIDGSKANGVNKQAAVKGNGVTPTELIFDVQANTTYNVYGAAGTVFFYYIGSTVPLKAYEEEKPTGAKINFKIAGTEAPSAKIHVAVLDGDPIDSTSNKVKLKGTIQELSIANSSKNFDNAAPGDKFIIIGEIDSSSKEAKGSAPNNVYKWVPIVDGTPTEDNTSISFVNNGDKSKNYFIYTVPDDAEVGKTYGVAFYTDTTDNLIKGTVSTDFKGDYRQAEDTSKTLVFGQYGVSEDKAVKNCGGGYVKDIAQKYQYAIPSMNDYLSNSLAEKAYNKIDPSSTESIYGTLHGLLHYNEDNNYIVFKVDDSVTNDVDENPITLQIDRSGNASMYDLGEEGTASPSSAMECEYISNSDGKKIAKQEYKIEAGHVYKIVSSGQESGSPKSGNTFNDGGSAVIPKNDINFGTAGASNVTQIKSIRVANPNNIFDETKDTQETEGIEGTLYSALDEKLQTELDGDKPDEEDTVFRIIGKIDVKGTTEAQIRAALSDIYAVGYDVYEKDDYDTADKASITYHYYAGATTAEGVEATIKETITFSDIVNSAIDFGTEKPEGSTITNGVGELNKVSNDSIFCQTFYALKPDTAVVLVPWVQYTSADSPKVYSKIEKTGGKENNVKVLSTKTN